MFPAPLSLSISLYDLHILCRYLLSSEWLPSELESYRRLLLTVLDFLELEKNRKYFLGWRLFISLASRNISQCFLLILCRPFGVCRYQMLYRQSMVLLDWSVRSRHGRWRKMLVWDMRLLITGPPTLPCTNIVPTTPLTSSSGSSSLSEGCRQRSRWPSPR